MAAPRRRAAAQRNRGVLERAAGVAGVAALTLAGAAGLVWLITRGGPAADRLPVPGEGEHILVEVLNTTETDGLARGITRHLRRAGIDVVSFGSAADRPVDSTTIVIRRGDSTAAQRVRAALGLGRIRSEPDARLLLDLSVFLGADATRVLDRHP